MGLVGGSIGAVGTLAGGQDGATIQNLGKTVDTAGNQAMNGNLTGALTSTTNQAG